MGVLAQLSQTTVDVEPGRSATIAMTVRNNGTVVDRFTFEALGSAAPWVTFAPTSLSLFPEASGTVNVILAPPRDLTAVAGSTPLGVRVVSSEDPTGSMVEEATVNVGAFSDVTLELVPRVVRGRVIGRGQLAVDNRSNCAYRATLSGSDPQGVLAFAFRPSVVDIPPGAAQFVKVGVRPASRFWRGPEKTHSFRLVLTNDPLPLPVTARTAAGGDAPSSRGDAPPTIPTPTAGGSPPPGTPSPGGPPAGGPARPGATPAAGTAVLPARPLSPHQEEISAEGSMLQEAMLPRWLVPVLAALVLLAGLLLLLWFLLFRPQIRSTATDQVNKQLAANGITPVSTGSKTPSGGSGGGSSGSGGGGGGSSTATTVATPAGGSTISSGATVNGVQQASGNGTKVVYNVPTGRSLQITDLLVENSAGDTGNLVLARNGSPVMQWSMANFRDLDYHWITPTVFGPGSQVQLIVSGCTGACTPAVYYAGHLVSG